VILLRHPLLQPLIRRRYRHHERGALVFADFDQPGHRLRRHAAQACQKCFVLECLPARQEVHRHIAAGVGLPRAVALRTVAGQQFYKNVLLCEIHASRLFPIMLPSLPGVQCRAAMVK
jgi:hypothetical protein